MHIMYFTERPYPYIPEEELIRNGGAWGLPTLVIWGKEDRIAPVNAAEVYHKAIAGSTLLVFERCGHRPEIECAGEFIARVQSFLVEGR